MLIRNFMTKNVITIDAEESMPKAIQLLKQHKINMMPVTQQGKIVGVITDRDLKKASPSEATDLDTHELKYLLNKIKIKDIMTKEVITVPPDFTIEEAAEVLMNQDISGAPVVNEQGGMEGIITSTRPLQSAHCPERPGAPGDSIRLSDRGPAREHQGVDRYYPGHRRPHRQYHEFL